MLFAIEPAVPIDRKIFTVVDEGAPDAVAVRETRNQPLPTFAMVAVPVPAVTVAVWAVKSTEQIIPVPLRPFEKRIPAVADVAAFK